MERVIDCPVCYDTDKCFEDVQETFKSYLCFNCGFMSDSRYEIDSLTLIENLKSSPQLVQDLQIKDKQRNIVWFPAVINMGEKGLIFPEGTTPQDYVWKYAQVVEVSEEERDKYDNYDRRLDIENAESFGQNGFLEACKAMGITQKIG
jgi:hypothetical protein|tara:strand:- start:1504 stop:1947 length:444 start_codon:yes stop_codon:yes gene_type:complete